MNKMKYIIRLTLLSLALFAFSGCTMTLPDGTTHKVGIAQKLGSIIYNPIYSNEQVGVNIVTKEKITAHKVVKIANPDGTITTLTEPIIEIVTLEEPVFKNVITDWKPNLLGRAVEFGFSLIPVPGAEEAAGAALLLGALGMGTQEALRRKKKKITDSDSSEKDKQIQTAQVEKEAAEENLQIAVGGAKDFMKTEEGQKVLEGLKTAFKNKAAELGMTKQYKTAVKVAKAIL